MTSTLIEPKEVMGRGSKPKKSPRSRKKHQVSSDEPALLSEHGGGDGRGAIAPRRKGSATAESMARSQREISVSEFFAKNRHLLGFDNLRKALLTTVKEAVDNALDACEEAGILPEVFVGIEQLGETRFRVTVRDNGPGIVRKQVENVFGRLLYGSKFHRLKMSRGQQGIGISAAGMYGLMTTGKPMVIHTRPRRNDSVHRIVLAIDTAKNRAEVTDDVEKSTYQFPHSTGTEVQIELEARYNRGRQSVDEYLELTAIANPHATIIFQPPKNAAQAAELDDDGQPRLIAQGNGSGATSEAQLAASEQARSVQATTVTEDGLVIFPQAVKELPPEPKEIKPHPLGIELGVLLKMAKGAEAGTKLGGFLQNEFCRVSPKIAGNLAETIGRTGNTHMASLEHADIEKLYRAIQETKFMAPPTDCLAPIEARNLLAGLLKGLKAEFYTAVTREPAVYRGNPFQIEVGIAYGGDLPAEESARVIRFANRVPLLYQQSACCSFKAVLDTAWRNYGMQQPRGSLPVGPLVVMIHMASVWVPFTSESKEAIADYDEIRKEMKLALSECGRKLKTYLNRRARVRREAERRNIFEKYMGETVLALAKIDSKLSADKLLRQFKDVAKLHTQKADLQFDEDGKPITEPIDEGFDETVVIVEENVKSAIGDDVPEDDESEPTKPKRRRAAKKAPASSSPSPTSSGDDANQSELFDT
jgi:DNA topoisomerase-6 subunit B